MTRITLPATFLILGMLGSTMFAQSEDPFAETLIIPNRSTTNLNRAQNMFQGNGAVAQVPTARWNTGNPATKIIKKYKAAEGATEKEDILDELRELLHEQYDKSLEAQTKRLDAMEEKLRKLRKQLERRQEAKKEIVELRIDVLVNEAEGLGWPDTRTSPFFVSPMSGQFPQPGAITTSPSYLQLQQSAPRSPEAIRRPIRSAEPEPPEPAQRSRRPRN